MTRLVAAAIRNYIGQLRKARHTAKLRDSDASSAAEARLVARDWDSISDEAWDMLDRAGREHN